LKLQFDPNQRFQLDAVAAVVDLFEDQPQDLPEFAVVKSGKWGGLFAQQEGNIVGTGNQLLLSEDRIRQNLRRVQNSNGIEVDDPSARPDGWEIRDPLTNQKRLCPQFSVEMETGTGKTYVYLRTIFELSHRYGFQKFIIVVPSVAIREGALKNIEITSDHFHAIYNNLPFEYFVYDGKKVSRLRHFAYANTLQIMVINIDAFRKNFTGTEEERKGNVIYKESDKLSGHQPIEFVQSARPIVIIDEPQSVDSTDKAQDAIKALNPLCALRYSATHRNAYNLVYRLDPVRAFEMRLVKQIVVASAAAQTMANNAFIRLEKIDYKAGIKAKLRIRVQGTDGPREKSVSVKQGMDLYALSKERAEYAQGFSIAEINAEPGNEYIQFTNGQTLSLGEEMGGMREEIMLAQIKHTIKRHLEKELQLRGQGIKVLSLFFIDKVANYREYDEQGQPLKGKLALAFEEELAALAKDTRYKDLTWMNERIEKLHDGYFAQDKKGRFKESREGRDTEAEDEVYNLIMKDKERLLSLEEPLRFIFSHSALREGWDNPNVFQICTLNETRSTVKKRQEIGRGLRLPVNQAGVRIFDDSVNKLYVMANESYEEFAKKLQMEYEEDCGVTFGKVPLNAFAKLVHVIEGTEVPVGLDAAEKIREALVRQGFLDEEGRIQSTFEPKKKNFRLELPEELGSLASAVVYLLSSYQLQRHIQREQDDGPNRLKKEVTLSPEFKALWERIKTKTKYRVEFESNVLVERATNAIKKMDRIEKPQIRVSAGLLGIHKGGVIPTAVSVAEDQVDLSDRPMPDILAYLQTETDLTRSTLARILEESGRLPEFFDHPQRFMDAVVGILKNELHRLLVDGVKYERIQSHGPEAEWEMMLFKNEELINYLTALQVNKSVYEYIVCDSEVEFEFSKRLDEREDIKLFVKLPNWFEVDTPVGKYNPDWAIVKHDDKTLYLVRETKGTKDFFKLRTTEADKVRCGGKHFEALGVSFAVVTSPDEV